MEVVFEVAEENLKILVAALHCLAQIGKELSLESDARGELTCRALNDAHSASGQVAFERSFFAAVHASDRGADLPCVRCKVFAKSCTNVFRTLKHVRSLQIAFLVTRPEEELPTQDDDELDVDCQEIRWRLRCDFDITKTHHMKVHAGQIMRAVFDRSSCPSHFVARHFHLSSLLAHIHHSNEVAVHCSESQVRFESYFSSTGDGKSHLHTETAVDSSEFQEYVISPGSIGTESAVQLIFCIKEVRALLAFCKASDIAEVRFYFSSSGSPVLLRAESTALSKFSVEVTLSTVTTFLPASSQRSEEEARPGQTSSHAFQDTDTAMNNGGTSQENSRYLTHSKRARIE